MNNINIKMRLSVTVMLIVLFSGLQAQKKVDYSPIDDVMIEMPDSITQSTQKIADFINSKFTNESDKTRAVFIWVTENVQYDVANMFAINFHQSTKEIVDIVLKTRKGVCLHYAELFYDIAKKVGLKSYVVQGYTKNDEFVDYVPHVWCAMQIDSVWYLSDPTWGSGHVFNKRFVRKLNNDYYKTKPEKLLKSHIPFDPLWQFMDYPITSQEFYDGEYKKNKDKPYFNYVDSLACYEKQSENERLLAIANRIEKNGVKNSMIFDKLFNIKKEIENNKNRVIYNKYNEAVRYYNEGIHSMNRFNDYRNKQFLPAKTDKEIKQMLDTIVFALNNSQREMSEIKNPDSHTSSSMVELNNTINDAMIKYDEYKAFLDKYLLTPVLKRKALFYKRIE